MALVLTNDAPTTTTVKFNWTGGIATDIYELAVWEPTVGTSAVAATDDLTWRTTDRTLTAVGLTPNTVYNAQVKTLVGTSTSAIIQVTTAAATVAPGPIGSLTPSNITTTGVTLTWTAPTTGGTPFSYVIQQSPPGTPVWTTVAGSQTSGLTNSVTGLAPGQTYQFQVVVSNLGGNNVSPTVQVTTLQIVPGQPTNLAVVGTPTTTSVQLSWAAPAAGTSPTYTVSYRTPSGSGSFTDFGTTTTATGLTVTGLTSAAFYDFEVRGSNTAGIGPESTVLLGVQTGPFNTLPSAPGNVTAGTVTSSSVQVNWTVPSSGFPASFTYTLNWRPTGTTTFTSVSAGSVLTATVTGLSPTTNYDFEVIATNSTGAGPASAITTIETAAVTVIAPSAPTGLTDSSVAQTAVTLTWVAPSVGTAPFNYQLQWSPHGLNTWTSVPVTQGLSATVTGLTASTSYDFQVSASNTAGTSAFSAPVFTVSTTAPPVTVTWANPTANMTLSGSPLLTATAGGSSSPNSSNSQTISSTSVSNTKFSFQITVQTVTTGLSVGLQNSLSPSPFGGGETANSIAYFVGGPAIFWNNTNVLPQGGGEHADTNGTIVTVCGDPVNNLYWFTSTAMQAAFGSGAWNNSATANPGTGVGGLSLAITGPLFIGFWAREGGGVCVLNAGTSPYVGPAVVPSTFPPWSGAVVTPVSPGQVTGLAVSGTPGSTNVSLVWTAPSTGSTPFTYTVQYKRSVDSTYVSFPTTTTSTTLNVTGLNPSTAYNFQVFASNAVGVGATSAVVNATTTAATAVPSAPQGMNLNELTTSSVTPFWQYPTTGTPPFSWTLQYRVTGTTAWTTAPAAISSPDNTSITPGVGTFEDNDGVIWAVTAGGQITTQVSGGSPVVDPVTHGVTQMVWVGLFIWQLAAGAWYRKQHATDATWVSQTSGPVLPTVGGQSETVGGLTAGTSYDFQVAATNSGGTGPFSTIVSGSTATQTTGGGGGQVTQALTVSGVNPRYMAIGANAVWVEASHTWEDAFPELPSTLTWQQWLDNVVRPEINNGNANCQGLVRCWLINRSHDDGTRPDSGMPWLRSSTPGSGDGNNKWDLTQFNQAYFNSLLAMVQYGAQFGIHFQMCLWDATYSDEVGVYLASDPLWGANNINGTQQSSNNLIQFYGPGSGYDTVTWGFQQAYITKLVQTLAAQPNVTYEPVNETHQDSIFTLNWITQVIATIRSVEAGIAGAFHHMCMQGSCQTITSNAWPNNTFSNTTANYLCPGWADVAPYNFGGGSATWSDIPRGGANGNQPIVLDTDHSLLSSTSSDAVARAFTRGCAGYFCMSQGFESAVTSAAQAPLYTNNSGSQETDTLHGMQAVRTALGLAPAGVLNNAGPQDSLCSTGFCLADTTNFYYFGYQSNGGSSFTMNLSAASGRVFTVSWVDMTTGNQLGTSTNYTATSSTTQSFTAPSNGGRVLLVLIVQAIVAKSLTVNNPGTQTVGVAFQESGGLIGYAAGAPTLRWSFDQTNWNAVPASGVTTTSYAFNITEATAGSYTVYVQDVNNLSVINNSGLFAVNATAVGAGSPDLVGVYFGEDPIPGQFGSPQQFSTAAGFRNPPNLDCGFSTDFTGVPYNWIFPGTPTLAAANISLIIGICGTSDLSSGSFNPQNIAAGMFDSGFQGWLQASFVNQGFTVQAGFKGKIFGRINWEQNIPFTTPGNYSAQQTWGNHGNGVGGGWAYWFNSGSNNPNGGFPTVTAGHFWAWRHLYNLLSYNVPTSLSRQLGVPLYIVWNPTCSNTQYSAPAGQDIAGYAIYMYPGDDFCDYHGCDIYSNHIFISDLWDYPGYVSAPPCTVGWPRGQLYSSYASWLTSPNYAGNQLHTFDFTDSSFGIQDGVPGNTPDPTGANSTWGWSAKKAIDFASVTGTFANAVDPVNGGPRKQKGLLLCETGCYNVNDYGCGGGGNANDDNPSGPQPSFQGRVGGCENMLFWPHISALIGLAQSKGIHVPAVGIYNCSVGTIMTQRMTASIGASFVTA